MLNLSWIRRQKPSQITASCETLFFSLSIVTGINFCLRNNNDFANRNKKLCAFEDAVERSFLLNDSNIYTEIITKMKAINKFESDVLN